VAVGKCLSQTLKKVSLKPFQRLAGSRGRALVARRSGRNSLTALSFCELFLWAFYTQRKSGRAIIAYFTPLTAAPLSAEIFAYQKLDNLLNL